MTKGTMQTRCNPEGISERFGSYLVSRIKHCVSSTKVRMNEDTNVITATELDSHADSPVVGRYSRVLEETGRTARVSGFSSELGEPLEVPIVNAAVAYDCDITGVTHILVICNALYLRSMGVNLIPPFMMRLAGLEMDECPKFLSSAPTERNHSMYFPSLDIRIPFHIEGIISYIPTRMPSESELMELEGSYLLITPNLPSWEPTPISIKIRSMG